VDGRYTLQDRDQVDQGTFEIRDLVEGGVPAYLETATGPGQVIGYDPRLHSPDALGHLKAAVAKAGSELRPVSPNPLDIAWVNAKLRQLVHIDQFYRVYPERVGLHTFTQEEQSAFARHMKTADIDRRNIAELKPLLARHGWFKISQFGAEADANAWLLIQHADHDIEFQNSVLVTLEPLAKAGETNPQTYAYLYDRVAVSFQDAAKRRLQRFGTQGRCTAPGTWEPWPVEEPETLDARRAQIGLLPEAEYVKGFKDLCHESLEDTLRRMEAAANSGG
jgi:hypothetical protein